MPGHDSDIKVRLSDIFGDSILDVAKAVAEATLPACQCCTRKAIPLRCFRCSTYVCQEHGFFNISRREGLCLPCLRDLLKSSGETETDVSPWEVLDINPGSEKSAIERAFRVKARKCHPDFHPGDAQKESEFRTLQWAREAALQEIGG